MRTPVNSSDKTYVNNYISLDCKVESLVDNRADVNVKMGVQDSFKLYSVDDQLQASSIAK